VDARAPGPRPAGRFEPRDVARLAAQVQIEELEPVANER